MKEKCPECGKDSFVYDNYNKRYKCLMVDCHGTGEKHGNVSQAFIDLGTAVDKYFKDESADKPKPVDGSAPLTTSTSLSVDELRDIRMFLLNMSHHCPSPDWQSEAKKQLVKIDQIIATCAEERSVYGERIQQAKAEERERIIEFIKNSPDYKLEQRKPSGKYFETAIHDGDWGKFRQSLRQGE